MNKGELVESIASVAQLSKTDAEGALNAFICIRAERSCGRRQGHTSGFRHICAVRPEGAHRNEPADS